MATRTKSQADRVRLRTLAPKLKSAALFSPAHFRALRANVAALRAAFPEGIPGTGERPLAPEALLDHLFDSVFLIASPLYRMSRQLFREAGGCFEARLTTSPRSLSSLILTENRVEYTPHQSEFLWTLEQRPFPRESVQRLITYSTSLFHEQNHRLLWRRIAPPISLNPESLRQYLNFMEALVVTLDMALGDQLGTGLSALGYLSGTLYDPGIELGNAPSRDYRNALHRALQATFLALEGYEPERIENVLVRGLPKSKANLDRRMVKRALRLDREFIERTNPGWQLQYSEALVKLWSSTRAQREFRKWKATPLLPSEDPLRWTQEYLLAEKIFDDWGV